MRCWVEKPPPPRTELTALGKGVAALFAFGVVALLVFLLAGCAGSARVTWAAETLGRGAHLADIALESEVRAGEAANKARIEACKRYKEKAERQACVGPYAAQRAELDAVLRRVRLHRGDVGELVDALRALARILEEIEGE